MKNLLFRRTGELIIVLVALSVLVFVLVRSLPGDPTVAFLGLQANPTAVAEMREELGLNESLFVQYFAWIRRVLAGDLGFSWVGQRPAIELIRTALPATVQLLLLAIPLALVVAVPLGIAAALRPRTWVDHLTTTLVVSGVSIPSFFIGILLILVFAQTLRVLPASGYVSILEQPWVGFQTTIMPAVALAVALAAPIARFLRSGLIDVLRAGYVRTAYSKGLDGSKVVLKHALRNAMLPVITVLGLQIGALIGGAVITEQVFAWPGIGRLTVVAIERRDYGVLQAIVLLIGAGYLVINYLVDLSYMLLDPRIKVGGRG